MALLIGLLIGALTSYWLAGILSGIIIWTLVLFTTPVFEWSFYNVKPNWALIVGNQTTWDTVPSDPNKRTEMFELASMREIGPGVRGKRWTEVVYDSVDLQSERLIGNCGQKNNLLRCYTSDNIALDIEWQDILTPLRGFLVNLVRKGEEASEAYFRGEFEQKIIAWVKSKREKEVFESLTDLKAVFVGTFGGPHVVSDKEMEYGTYTNTPQIISVNRSVRYQDATEGVAIADRLREATNHIHNGFAGEAPDPNMVLATAAASVGLKVEGLVLIPGLTGKGKDAANLLAAGQAIIEKTRNTGGKK